MSNRRYQALTLAVIAGFGLLPGCATSKGEMAWVRIDGQRIAEDQTLLKQGQADVALCHADLDAGTVGGRARECMNQRGYALVTKEQAEETRARFAATAAQHETAQPPEHQ